MLKPLLSVAVIFFITITLHAQPLLLFPIKDYVTYDRNNNTLTVSLGYTNGEATSLNVPFGSSNIMLPAPFFRGQPTNFEIGTHHNVFTVTFAATNYLEWNLGDTLVHASMTDLDPIQYQGRLSTDGAQANGSMEFQFALFDAVTNGNQVLNTFAFEGASAVPVNNGLFNATLLWSPTAFTNSPRWLEIRVRAVGETNYVTLSPRQQFGTTPFAANAQSLDGISPKDVARLSDGQTFIGIKTFSAGMRLSGRTNTWSVYCAPNGVFTINNLDTLQNALTINPNTLNVSVVSLSQTSDRNAKENFGDINSLDVLEKVASLDIQRWNFKGDTNSVHIGPMAQDFYAAFGTGADERHIATVDADGVALAAIQGLNKKLSDKETEIETLRRENKELADRLRHIEEVLKVR